MTHMDLSVTNAVKPRYFNSDKIHISWRESVRKSNKC